MYLCIADFIFKCVCVCVEDIEEISMYDHICLIDDLSVVCSTSFRNKWSPPDKKVDTRKYRAEPRSIFDYQPGKSSILEQEKAVSPD